MNLRVEKINDNLVKKIIEWKYDGIYSVYNLPAYEILKEQNWSLVNQDKNDEYRVIYNNNELLGWFRFQKNKDNTLGLGMDPKMCGKGYGKIFVDKIIEYLNEDIINLEVREFNKRAVACYKKCGFKEIDKCEKNTLAGKDIFILMQYKKEI